MLFRMERNALNSSLYQIYFQRFHLMKTDVPLEWTELNLDFVSYRIIIT